MVLLNSWQSSHQLFPYHAISTGLVFSLENEAEDVPPQSCAVITSVAKKAVISVARNMCAATQKELGYECGPQSANLDARS